MGLFLITPKSIDCVIKNDVHTINDGKYAIELKNCKSLYYEDRGTTVISVDLEEGLKQAIYITAAYFIKEKVRNEQSNLKYSDFLIYFNIRYFSNIHDDENSCKMWNGSLNGYLDHKGGPSRFGVDNVNQLMTNTLLELDENDEILN